MLLVCTNEFGVTVANQNSEFPKRIGSGGNIFGICYSGVLTRHRVVKYGASIH